MKPSKLHFQSYSYLPNRSHGLILKKNELFAYYSELGPDELPIVYPGGNMLFQSSETDKDELIEFIDTLVSKDGPRYMVDLQELVVQYYYSVHMKGSNSIKYVLPAILNESAFLKEEYSKPYSGLSIQDKVLYVEENGIAVNPYTLLDPLGIRDVPDDIDEIIGDFDVELGETIADGGKAIMAWSRMQFDDIPEDERESTFKGLLRYCELDTLAMVMIYQHWISLKN